MMAQDTAPVFPDEAKISAEVNEAGELAVSFPEASGYYRAENYKITLSSNGETVENKVVLSDYTRATDLENADKVKCPVFLCQASKDIIINDTMKSQMNEAFPDATKYLVEGGGHQCIENRADEICKATLDFLK